MQMDMIELELGDLPEGEDFLRRLIANVRDVLCQVDLSGVIRYVSPSVTPQLGYRAETIVGHAIYDYLHPDEVAAVRAALQRAGWDRSPEPLEHRWRHAEGPYVWYETRSTAMRGSRGQVIGVIFCCRDISERRHAQAELAAARADYEAAVDDLRRRVEAADRAKSEFLACVSHELRTPLSGIIGGLGLVLKGMLASPAEERESMELAYSAGQRLLHVINQILDAANLQADAMPVYPLPVATRPVVEAVISQMRPMADHKHLSLQYAISQPELQVRVDPHLLRKILLNLVHNAIEFTGSGYVRVREHVVSGRAEIIVEDTGAGIAPDLRARLFQPFVQGDSSSTRRHGGTGLGLYLSRRLAELMGGSLTLLSVGEGHGATCVLELPLAEAGDLAAEDQAGG
jgi:PAS domain S-box-containing protein